MGLLQGQVDVVAMFTATSDMNLVALKRDLDKDFRWIYFADCGLDRYSNGVMVSRTLASEKPQAAKGLVRAIAKATRDIVGDIADGRMASAIATMVEPSELPRAPTVAEVFDRSFLPASADRVLPAVGN
jgi:NitT/TauT family transport system substrate-binding protein